MLDEAENDKEFCKESYCEICKKETLHEYSMSGHERDSYHDWKHCTICGKTTNHAY